MNNDTLLIGGHEFHSRFILGSGKYSLKLIEAAVKDAGAELITLAVRRANTRAEENILDYIPKGRNAAAQYQGRQKCRRSYTHCPSGKRTRLRKFCKNRNHAGFQIPAA